MAGIAEFTKKISTDKAFAEELAKAKSNEEFLAKAEEAGFKFSDEELTELTKPAEGELSDDELKSASGGYYVKPRACPRCGHIYIPSLGPCRYCFPSELPWFY